MEVDGRPCDVNDNSPVVIVQHGLCGDSNVEYVIHLVELLSRLKYRVVVVVARGCGGVKMSTAIPFSFGKTLDFKEVVDHIHEKYSAAKLLAVGFSLGACLTLRHVAIHCDDSPLSGAFCVSPPWDFMVPSTISFQLISTRILVSAIKLYYWLNRDSVDPEIARKIYSASSVLEYDEIIAPVLGYKDVVEYYSSSSPRSVTNRIRIPTLAISSVDDPFCNITGCPHSLESGQIGPGLVVAITELGGHLGFAEDLLPFTTSWTDRVCIDWFKAILDAQQR